MRGVFCLRTHTHKTCFMCGRRLPAPHVCHDCFCVFVPANGHTNPYSNSFFLRLFSLHAVLFTATYPIPPRTQMCVGGVVVHHYSCARMGPFRMGSLPLIHLSLGLSDGAQNGNGEAPWGGGARRFGGIKSAAISRACTVVYRATPSWGVAVSCTLFIFPLYQSLFSISAHLCPLL